MSGDVLLRAVRATLHVELDDGTVYDVEMQPPPNGELGIVIEVHQDLAEMPDPGGGWWTIRVPRGKPHVRIEADGELVKGGATKPAEARLP